MIEIVQYEDHKVRLIKWKPSEKCLSILLCKIAGSSLCSSDENQQVQELTALKKVVNRYSH